MTAPAAPPLADPGPDLDGRSGPGVSEAAGRAASASDPPRQSITQRFVTAVERGICEPGESGESRLRKVRFTFAAVLVVPAGVIWGAIYLAAGEPRAAVFPLAYALATLLGIGLLLRSGRFERFRLTQQVAIYVLPVCLHVELGGFVGSGGVIVWSYLAVMMAVLFGGEREARGWFGLFALAVVMVALLRPSIAVDNNLPIPLVLAFFVMNLGAVAFIVFAVLQSFLADRRKLRELEIAYLEQEVALHHSEKLASLGTLAAGMAHELNNPAAAASRGVAGLRDAIEEQQAAYVEAVAGISPEHGIAVERARSMLRDRAGARPTLSPLDRSAREGEMDDWLADLGVGLEEGPAAGALVERGFTVADLDRATSDLPDSARLLFASCLARACGSDELLAEVSASVDRVSRIVDAMRSYTFLDQGPVQEVDVVAGLEDTLAVLGGRIGPGLDIVREFEPESTVQANGGELNQVWTHLIRNALDAMEGAGTLTLRARRTDAEVHVDVQDSGPGMPAEVLARAFDPFFTTRPPGAGAGLGLTVCQNIIARRHGGRISIASEPGCTVVTVILPAPATRG